MIFLRSRPDPRDVLIAALRAELSDLRTRYQQVLDQGAEERRALVDRILALTHPGALREVKRTPLGEQSAPANPRRIHYPGTDTRVAPPPPSKPLFPPLDPPAGVPL